MDDSHYRIEYGESALEDLENLPLRIRSQVIRKIERLSFGLHGNIKRLQRGDAAFRLRMGDYRVLFDVEGSIILIRRIGDRKDIYD